MNELLLDHELRALFTAVPAAASSATIDRALAEAGVISQRHARFGHLDQRAWPPQARSVTDPVLRRSGRVLAIAVVALLLATAVLAVGARLLDRRLSVTLTPAGSLDSMILGPQAVALPDGRILVNGQGPATIFDPRTGASTQAYLHLYGAAAQLLPDGRLLLLGSESYQQATPESTVVAALDLATGAFTRLGAFPTPYFAEATVLLRDGRLLVSGGLDPRETPPVPMTDVGVFDLATGAFTKLGPLQQPRIRHSMVALDDGRVLVIGGAGPGGVGPYGDVLEVEAYDPATGRSVLVGAITAGRGLTAPTPVRLGDGRILIPAGPVAKQACGAAARAGMATFLFDPVTNRLTTGPELPHFVARAVSLPDGPVVVFGVAETVPGGCASNAEPTLYPWLGVLDPSTGTTVETRGPASGRSTLPFEIQPFYADGVLLPNGRVALIADDPSQSQPNQVDILTVTR